MNIPLVMTIIGKDRTGLVESIARAQSLNLSLMATAIRAAEVKSGSRSSSSTKFSRTMDAGISRSTIAPPTIWPAVG